VFWPVGAAGIFAAALSASLEAVVRALEEGRSRRPRALCGTPSEPEVEALRAAVASAHESARLSLRPGQARERLAGYLSAAERVELAMNNVRVLARGVVRAFGLGGCDPPRARHRRAQPRPSQ
jgi:hypothetical protein